MSSHSAKVKGSASSRRTDLGNSQPASSICEELEKMTRKNTKYELKVSKLEDKLRLIEKEKDDEIQRINERRRRAKEDFLRQEALREKKNIKLQKDKDEIKELQQEIEALRVENESLLEKRNKYKVNVRHCRINNRRLETSLAECEDRCKILKERCKKAELDFSQLSPLESTLSQELMEDQEELDRYDETAEMKRDQRIKYHKTINNIIHHVESYETDDSFALLLKIYQLVKEVEGQFPTSDDAETTEGTLPSPLRCVEGSLKKKKEEAKGKNNRTLLRVEDSCSSDTCSTSSSDSSAWNASSSSSWSDSSESS